MRFRSTLILIPLLYKIVFLPTYFLLLWFSSLCANYIPAAAAALTALTRHVHRARAVLTQQSILTEYMDEFMWPSTLPVPGRRGERTGMGVDHVGRLLAGKRAEEPRRYVCIYLEVCMI